MPKSCKQHYVVFAFFVAGQFVGTDSCYAESISPSQKTRTFPATKADYFQQTTKGQPFRWFDRDMAVRVHIKSSANVPNHKPKFEEILRESFKEWEKNSSSKISFQFVTEAPADITCQFVVNLAKQKPCVAGLTEYQTSPYHMDSAVISIKTSSTITSLTDDLMRGICLHEIGHALGLVNHSLDPHDVMFPFVIDQRSLSARDVNTIRLLYEFKPPPTYFQSPKSTPLDLMYPGGHIVLSSDDYDAYMRQVAAKLLKQFSPYSAKSMLECNVRCLVDSNGNIYNYRIFEGSNDEEFDQKVISTLLSVLPLPAVPERLRKNQWSKAPIALKFRSDGWIIPYVEPDRSQSDWLQAIEEPSPDEMMKALNKFASPKIIDPVLEPWIVAIAQKAQSKWKIEGKGRVEVVAGINSLGKIAHLVVIKSSGDEAFDNSVLNACVSAEPYPPAPKGPRDTTEVNLLFEH